MIFKRKEELEREEKKEIEVNLEKNYPSDKNDKGSTKSKRKMSEQKSNSRENKMRLMKKKTIKEEDNIGDGDIYMKYLKKAMTIWEDFTTGKKKVKEESSEAPGRKMRTKNKSININKNSKESNKLQRKITDSKTNSYQNSQSNVKKKVKKTLICQETPASEPNKIIITTKTQLSNQNSPEKSNPSSKPQNNIVAFPVSETKPAIQKAKISSADPQIPVYLPENSRSSQLKVLDYEVCQSNEKSSLNDKISRIKT